MEEFYPRRPQPLDKTCLLFVWSIKGNKNDVSAVSFVRQLQAI
jgi:hypothetical protein